MRMHYRSIASPDINVFKQEFTTKYASDTGTDASRWHLDFERCHVGDVCSGCHGFSLAVMPINIGALNVSEYHELLSVTATGVGRLGGQRPGPVTKHRTSNCQVVYRVRLALNSRVGSCDNRPRQLQPGPG